MRLLQQATVKQFMHRYQILVPAYLATQLQQQKPHELPRSALRLEHERRARLRAELLQQLRIAVQDGEKDRLDELIAVVANQNSQSARALKELADKYEYDTLTNLLTEATR